MMDVKEQIDRALELVADGLRSGGIPAHNFSMGRWMDGQHCGSVGCIGGWVFTLLDRAGLSDAAARLYEEANYTELTHPNGYWCDHFTPLQAARAIDRFRAGKKPWPGR